MKEYKLIAGGTAVIGDFTYSFRQPSDIMAKEYCLKIVRFFQPGVPFTSFILWQADKLVSIFHISSRVEVKSE